MAGARLLIWRRLHRGLTQAWKKQRVARGRFGSMAPGMKRAFTRGWNCRWALKSQAPPYWNNPMQPWWLTLAWWRGWIVLAI